MASDGSATRIGVGTWISGGIFIAAVVGTGTVVTMARDLQHGLMTLTLRADQTAAAVDRIQDDLSSLKWQLADTANDRWTGADMRSWAWELQRANAGLVVPKVEHDATAGSGSKGR